MANLNFPEKIKQAASRLKSKEQMLGSGLLQPFNNTNSGARKLMHSVHRTHTFVLLKPEKAQIETGYEQRFGEYASSLKTVDGNYQIIAKISKFSFAPNHHYWLILRDLENNRLTMVERIAYKHITESYGYLYNNDFLDRQDIGSVINKGEVIQKSLAFDEFNNRQDGVNLNVAYMALDQNMEDSIVFSDEAAKKMVAPLIKPVNIMMNENDIPLNYYGDNNIWKCFPDIGEPIKDGILLAFRKEKKEECLFMQSVDRMKKPMMSDEKFTLHGTVIDVDVYCNNSENLDSIYNGQFKMYYEESQRVAREFVSCITPYTAQGFILDYDLQKKFALSKRVMNKDQYMDKRLFSNMVINITVLEELPLLPGDKASNRYGGKGIVSCIRPVELMPRIKGGEHVDAIFNSSTMYNRENPGQLMELSLNHISSEIVKLIKHGDYTAKEAFLMITDFVRFCSPTQAEELMNWGIRNAKDEENIKFFINSVCNDGCIHISSKPMSESMDIDRLNAIYERFPEIQQCEIEVPIKDSNGNIRFIDARRRMVVGKQYIFRLKQFAEEKFSATSLSATNIRNENTKSKASRDYRELYSNTPIRAGNMEIDNLNHIGAEYVVTNLLLESLSPHGRRLVEKYYTDDPYNTDIKLDQDSSNRSAEIVNTYLKTMGLRIKFIKIRKRKIKPFKIHAINFDQDAKKNPIFFNNQEGFDFVKDFEERSARNKRVSNSTSAIRFFDNPSV